MLRNLALALSFALPAVALARTAPETRPAGMVTVDSMRTVVNRGFELYARTDDELRGPVDEMRVAVSQFGEFLGEHPKKMAFVLFRSAEERDRFDFRSFTRRGIDVVTWIQPAKPPGGSAGAPAGSGAKPFPHEAAHRFLNAYADHALEVARGRAGSAAAPDEAPEWTRHDATPSGHVGHEALPDWFEEAVAMLCERPGNQTRHMEFMRARLDRRIPFAELLTMARPEEPDEGRGTSAGGAKGAGATKGASGSAKGAGGSAADPERAAIFRAEALSLARFIAHREYTRFIGAIADGVLRGRTVGDVLNTSQHLLSKPEALEKQWLEWMQGRTSAP